MQRNLRARSKGMKADPADRRLLTVQQVAEICGISPKTVRRWIASGELHVYRLGRQLRVSPSDLAAFLKLRQQ
jgi:excisionase family DNA binding protein